MAEYIEKQTAIDAINHELLCGSTADACGLETAYDLIHELKPADVRPVVLCKNCCYSREPDRSIEPENAACDGVLICFVGYDQVYPPISNDIFVDGEHFCRFGEVRND